MNVELGKIYNCYIVFETKGVKSTKTREKAKTYAQGRELELMAVNSSKMHNGYLLSFLTKDGYLIPQINVGVLDAVQMEYNEAEVVDEGSNVKQEVLNVKPTKVSKSGSKLMINMSILGGVLGLAYAMKTKGNKYMFASIGVIGMGYMSKYIKVKK